MHERVFLKDPLYALSLTSRQIRRLIKQAVYMETKKETRKKFREMRQRQINGERQ